MNVLDQAVDERLPDLSLERQIPDTYIILTYRPLRLRLTLDQVYVTCMRWNTATHLDGINARIEVSICAWVVHWAEPAATFRNNGQLRIHVGKMKSNVAFCFVFPKDLQNECGSSDRFASCNTVCFFLFSSTDGIKKLINVLYIHCHSPVKIVG